MTIQKSRDFVSCFLIILHIFFKYVLTKHVLYVIIIMQGGKQNANETKGNGKANPCRRMDV